MECEPSNTNCDFVYVILKYTILSSNTCSDFSDLGVI